MPSPTIRIARPTNNLIRISTFYSSALGLATLGSFVDHAGLDGVMLGRPEYARHLEFTHQRGVTMNPPQSKENLLVFYLPEKEEWEAAVARVEEAGGKRIKNENPYWVVMGATFEDPDGWCFVLQNAAWP